MRSQMREARVKQAAVYDTASKTKQMKASNRGRQGVQTAVSTMAFSKGRDRGGNKEGERVRKRKSGRKEGGGEGEGEGKGREGKAGLELSMFIQNMEWIWVDFTPRHLTKVNVGFL